MRTSCGTTCKQRTRNTHIVSVVGVWWVRCIMHATACVPHTAQPAQPRTETGSARLRTRLLCRNLNPGVIAPYQALPPQFDSKHAYFCQCRQLEQADKAFSTKQQNALHLYRATRSACFMQSSSHRWKSQAANAVWLRAAACASKRRRNSHTPVQMAW
jgi:hypothetical protein